MNQSNKYRQIIRTVLKPYAEISYANVDVKNLAAFDTETDQYIILSEGWENSQHLHSVLIHVEIMDGKVWVQMDGTEYGIAQELIQPGIYSDLLLMATHIARSWG